MENVLSIRHSAPQAELAARVVPAPAAPAPAALSASFQCPIDLVDFVDPVTAPCGHTICQGCYLGWVAARAGACCPTCRAPLPRAPPAINIALRNAQAEAAQRRPAPSLTVIAEADLAFDNSAGGMLGRGSFGEVRRAAWQGTPVAVKYLQADSRGAPARSFEREVAILARLRHPNVLNVFGVCRLGDGRLALVEELAVRGSLFQRLHPAREEGEGGAAAPSAPPARLSVKEVARLGLDVARALAAAHAAGVTHNDVKSMNVLLNAAGAAVLADFGLAKRVRNCNNSVAARLASADGSGQGGLLGSIEWTAPENLNEEGAHYGQPPADVYSFGVLLFEMASGIMPWGGKSIVAIVDAVRAGRRPEAPPGVVVDGRLRALTARCWAQDPGARPSARDLVVELAALVQGR